MKNDKTIEKKHRGIVARVDTKIEPKAKPASDQKTMGGDISFSPDYTVTNTKDGGGKVLTDVEVILCFWGSFWSTTPAPTPSRNDYEQAFQGILTGPYLGGLRQYRGVGQGTIIFSEINDDTSPANLYTDAEVVTMLKDRIQNHGMPAPVAGHNRFYAVIAPKGISNSLTQFAGQHQSFTLNGETGYYAWVDNTGSLTGHDATTKVFSHELTEACTNPDVDTSNDSILVDGTGVTNDEIGDTCNNEFATVNMNGILCSVQSYWSKADNACILPLGTLAFWANKNSFGKDEVLDIINTQGGKWEKAFWLIVDGFSKNAFMSLGVTVPVPTGPFANLAGITISQNPDIDFENNADPGAVQRIRIAYDITFTNAALSDFPATGSQLYELDGKITIGGATVQGTDTAMEFELLAGADPYFTNIDPNQNNVFYLSQDLRVFTGTPALNHHPVTGGPSFSTDSVNGAFTYIQDLITHLNTNFSDPNGSDPFSSVLPAQGGALTGDSSVTPFTFDFSDIFHPKFFNNYNFAVARVRLRGSAGPSGAAKNVRVFFRLWSTQTADTDFQPSSTYPSTPDGTGHPGSPLVGTDHHTIPFFATGNLTTHNDYGAGGANIRDIEIPAVPAGKDSIWAYYGCFLNIYDGTNKIDNKTVQAWLNGTHHCIVAEIADDDAHVFTGASPENSDKLAQRNLQVTHSDNPGPADTHRVPQTFDIRPTLPIAGALTYPDELMIDWGKIPHGSTASIFWPQVDADDVLTMATKIYGSHTLSAADNHTIQCKVTGGVTYIPILAGSGENFAGLITVDLPLTVKTGQEYNVIVRRVTSKLLRKPTTGKIAVLEGQKPKNPGEKNPGAKAAEGAIEAQAVAKRPPVNWRYVVGTFEIKIPVTTKEVMLFPEENTLAIMKWRLGQMATTSRWYPVLKKYIEYISARVDGLGGNADGVKPSVTGVPPKPGVRPGGKGEGRGEEKFELTGKISGLIFDRFGDFEGFILDTEEGDWKFFSREFEMEELAKNAWQDRLRITVWFEGDEPNRPLKVILRQPPVSF